jgi:hypothetical protein
MNADTNVLALVFGSSGLASGLRHFDAFRQLMMRAV